MGRPHQRAGTHATLVDIYRNRDFRHRHRRAAIRLASSFVSSLVANPCCNRIHCSLTGISYVFVVDEKGVIIAHTFVPGVLDEILADYKNAKNVYDRTLSGLGNFSEVTAGILAGEDGYVHVGMDKGYIALQVKTAIRIGGLLLRCICLLLAHSGHPDTLNQCLLLGVKRTSESCPRRGNFPFSRSGGDGFDDADGRFGRHNSL